MRYKKRRIVARAYVNRDYGIAGLNAEMAVTKNKISMYFFIYLYTQRSIKI
jgi:hypothetical protein